MKRYSKWLCFVANLTVVAGLAQLGFGCAADAVKPKSGNAPSGIPQITSGDLDRLPALTLESIRQQFEGCGLPVDLTSNPNAYSGNFATPGPLMWAHQASGCSLVGTSIGNVSVSPSASLSGPFKNPVWTFLATQTIASSCSEKYTNQAASDAAPYQRTIRYDVMPIESRPERIGNIGPWKKAICTLAPVTGITHDYKFPGTGNNAPQSARVQIEFIPALPAIVVSASATKGAFANELAKGLRFEKIVARVKSSNDPRYIEGREITGMVTVETIANPQKVVVDPDAKTQTAVRADIGIRITADFGGVQVTQALGLFPWVEYFIDKAAGTVKFISVANPDPDPIRAEILFK